MKKQIIYFGCIREAGHYFWADEFRTLNHRKIEGVTEQLLGHIDTTFCPPKYEQGVYQVSRIGDNVVIISWWDNSVDSRAGSNSNIIAIGYKKDVSITEIVQDWIIKFPSVMSRQEKNLKPIKFN